jgi:DNA-binding MarR family transcriptional regulator
MFSQALENLARIYQLQDPRRTCTYGITLTECYALEALASGGPLTVNEVARALGLDKSTASRAVASLVKKGLASRRSRAADRRSVSVSATPAGARLYRRIREAGRTAHRELLEEFPPEVRRGAAALLQRLVTTERACAGSGPRALARK